MEGVSDGYGRLHVYRKGDFAFLDALASLKTMLDIHLVINVFKI